MKTELYIQNLVKMCREYSGESWVQGAGGNVSVKDGLSIIIKKSGLCFKDITDENGFVSLGLTREHLLSILQKENDLNQAQVKFDQAINKTQKEKNGKPSLELSFHLLGGKYVLHVHPTLVNILGCSKEGQEILLKIEKNDPELLCIPYVKPGLVLTKKIYQMLKQRKMEKLPLVTVLFNHGVIVTGASLKEVKESLGKFLSRIQNEVKEFFLGKLPSANIPQGFLYPDAVVYCWDKSKIVQEVWDNHLCVYNFILQRKWTPLFLSKAKVSELLNWEAEKYRQKMVKF